jgi:hypothetical protein
VSCETFEIKQISIYLKPYKLLWEGDFFWFFVLFVQRFFMVFVLVISYVLFTYTTYRFKEYYLSMSSPEPAGESEPSPREPEPASRVPHSSG